MVPIDARIPCVRRDALSVVAHVLPTTRLRGVLEEAVEHEEAEDEEAPHRDAGERTDRDGAAVAEQLDRLDAPAVKSSERTVTQPRARQV